jgi:NAD(P)-dependent dehydrogenase (short-subunit alcohol dehydrogenase family)
LKAEFPETDYRFLQVDLSSQESVRAAAATVLAWDDVPSINILINSAGVMGIPERILTKDGIELTLATNHVGHWLLSCLIMPKLIKAAETNPRGATRIVNVSSGSVFVSAMRWSDMTFEKKNKDLPVEEQPLYNFFEAWGYKETQDATYNPLDSYNRSKVANSLFGIGANARLFKKHGILTLAVHPGVIHTDLGRNFPNEVLQSVQRLAEQNIFTFKSLNAGSSTAMVAALDPNLAVGVGETHNGSENWGAFLADCQIAGNAIPGAVSSKDAEKLWAMSEKWVGQTFAW